MEHYSSHGSFTRAPTIRFTRTAYERMMSLVRACRIEVSGFGVLATDEERESKGVKEPYYIKEIHIAEQDCTGVTTDLRAGSLGKLMMALHQRKVNGKQVCVWWHSHVNMSVSPSGTDVDTLNGFDFDDFAIGVIANKRGELGIRIEMYKPHRYSFTGCDFIVDDSNIVPAGWAEDMIKQHVHIRPATRLKTNPHRPALQPAVRPNQSIVHRAAIGSVHVDNEDLVFPDDTDWQRRLREVDSTSDESDDWIPLGPRGEDDVVDLTPEQFLEATLARGSFSERIFPTSKGKVKVKGHIHHALLALLAYRHMSEDIDDVLAVDALYGVNDTLQVIFKQEELAHDGT